MVKKLFDNIVSAINHENINSINNEYSIEQNVINELQLVNYHLKSKYQTLKQENEQLNLNIEQLQKQLSLLRQENVDLKRKLNIDSSNISLPPSSDMFTNKKIHKIVI